MSGYQRLLAALIAATLVAGVAGVLVKDTTPGGPTASDSPTPTFSPFSPSPTQTQQSSPTQQASPTTRPSPTPEPSKTRKPKPSPEPTPTTLPTSKNGGTRTPETGVAINIFLGLALLAAAMLLNRVRRRPI